MSDGDQGKDVGRAERQGRRSFGETSPSGKMLEWDGQAAKEVPSHEEVEVSVIPPLLLGEVLVNRFGHVR